MKKTKFYNCHLNAGAKMVSFAGFEMPIQYSSIIAEHKAVRQSAGVFDVSHMGEITVKGEHALELVQHITINNAAKLEKGKVQYSAMCYEDGGIVDDLLVYMIDDNEYMLVVNGANKDKDLEWINLNNIFNADIKDESDDYSLLAVQGPKSKKIVEKFFNQEINIDFYTFVIANIFETEVLISRTGYTGELGFELYFKGDFDVSEMIWNKLFEAGNEFDLMPTGLGCRDSLRLEMGYCLYGNDIDSSTSPLEAGLGWITKLKKGEFIGSKALIDQKENGVTRKLVPIIFSDRAFPRKDYEIQVDNKTIGKITSGTVSPILEKPIALGYVESEFAEEKTELNVLIRGKKVSAYITKLPFIDR